MFYDWLSIYQDHDFKMPLVSGRYFIAVDSATGEDLGIRQDTLNHAGSFSTSINIRISGNRVTVTGNPSRINRTDNLFGYTSIDDCVAVYNKILATYGLPPFTKATKYFHTEGKNGRLLAVSDGAVFTEIHITSNLTVGKNNVESYIRAISTLPYMHSIPRLHTNGQTCDWLTKAGRGGSLIYPSVYNKSFELELHALPKLKRSHGIESDEYKYLLKLIEHCKEQGVVRFEQKLKSAFLRRNKIRFYGMFKDTELVQIHNEFINLDKNLQVEHMTLESITQKLITNGICDNTRSANTTTLYAIQWMHGHTFDLSKSQVKTHRARLRKIGIDIAMTCDITKFSLVTVRESRAITVGKLIVPNWYRRAEQQHLKLAA